MFETPPARPPRARENRVYVVRLGRHHFAHLRSVAEGVAIATSAHRYLGIEHGHEATTAHRQVMDKVRAVARRHHESAWRLVGLAITIAMDGSKPTLEDFIAQRDLDGWSEAEVADMYGEAYPVNARMQRRIELRNTQMALLKRLEVLAAEVPSPNDPVEGWFDDVLAPRLMRAGIMTLGELNRRMAGGGRWYRTLPGIGETKAQRITAFLATLLPPEKPMERAIFTLETTPSLFRAPSPALPRAVATDPNSGVQHTLTLVESGRDSGPRDASASDIWALANSALPSPVSYAVQGRRLLDVNSDLEAVEAWIQARAGSLATIKAYRKEAHRLLLWLRYERLERQLGEMTVGDCADFMAFLEHVPDRWILRTRAAPGTPGWAPFMGQLSKKSRRQAITIIAALFTWLQSAQYIRANPWVLLNQRTGDDRDDYLLDSKAISEPAMDQILRFVEAQSPSPSRSRMLFILRFVEAVGLRSAEIVSAKLGDIHLETEGWVMSVHGKGAKNRIAAIPGQGFSALQDYLFARGLGGIEHAPSDAPLLASALDPMEPVGYQALYETVKNWLKKAIAEIVLPTSERLKLYRASTHWLRHTFGTRAIAREVPLDVIQAQMGHASIQTTTAIYGRAPIRRRVSELGKAFDLHPRRVVTN